MLTRALFLLLPAIFSLALFLSAGLLFLVEPIIAKMILPLLGGTPAVWNTCMMFFQAVLLAGYYYAHISGSKARINRQILIHLVVSVAACAVLPISISRHWAPSSEGSPIGYILLLLLISVGLPFFILSSNSLLLQKWFADTGHPSAKDPYFLYSASNLGSMLALISYPTVIEPYFRLAEQSRAWSWGYVVLLAFTVLCAWLTRKYLVPEGQGTGNSEGAACIVADSPLPLLRRCSWILLAFVPSSLMLGVTTFLSTDVAAVPLFWIIPLSLYLLSFIIVFARIPAVVHRGMLLLMPLSVTALIVVTFSDLAIPKWIVFIFHLVNFFVYCMVCHGEIARSRPATHHLTEFYLSISIGGVLGGIFNALIAPVAFSTVLEYPLVLILGAMLLPVRNRKTIPVPRRWKEGLLYVGIPLVLVLLTYWFAKTLRADSLSLAAIAALLDVKTRTLFLIGTFGSLALLCGALVFLKRPLLFGIGIAAVLMTLVVSKDLDRDIVHRERSFYGVLTVERTSDGEFMSLYHGTTLHGKEWITPDKHSDPLTYYHPQGPVGQVFSEFSGDRRKTRIAVTGLGAGTIAAYAEAGQEIDFYEIDPAVRMIAINTGFFSYLTDCRARWRIILGDARLTMTKAPPHHYGIIILDAFSSDAIPVHLLTREAVALYFSKLSPDGVLLVHISNRYVNLAPILGRLADDSGLACMISSDREELGNEKSASTWVLLARRETDFGALARSALWGKIRLQKTVKTWTDDFSDILSIFKW
ncbi:MAG: fused MFS/spermidine synthase [Deltaproteobacteria bacterium]|nr:fused MFS/spermidine synthase [Deltaproteobacteria bacterium]